MKLLPGVVGRILVASCVSGLVLGLAARAVMRFVALESGLPNGFSIGGSLEVVAFGAILGAPIAFLFFALRRRIKMGRPWPGVILGSLLFGIVTGVPPPAARSALTATPDTPAATALAFAVVFVAWGLWLEYLASRVLGAAAPGGQREGTPVIE